LKSVLAAAQVFQGGDRLFLLQKDFSGELKKHVSFQRKPSVLEGLHLEHYFPGELSLFLEKIFPANQVFKWRRLILLHILLFICIGETHLSLQGKPSMLEVAASSTLLPCDNGVSF
jgi:hypothetical protein